MGCRRFHPPIKNMDRSITTFGSIVAFITKFYTNLSFNTPFWNKPSFITLCWLLSKFSNFSHPSRTSDYFSKFSPRGRWDMSNYQPTHSIHFSWDLLDINPTLLRCHDFFVHPSRRMDPTQKFVRRHQHDLTSAQVRTPADLVSHHSQDIPEQQLDRKTLLHSELPA